MNEVNWVGGGTYEEAMLNKRKESREEKVEACQEEEGKEEEYMIGVDYSDQMCDKTR